MITPPQFKPFPLPACQFPEWVESFNPLSIIRKIIKIFNGFFESKFSELNQVRMNERRISILNGLRGKTTQDLNFLLNNICNNFYKVWRKKGQDQFKTIQKEIFDYFKDKKSKDLLIDFITETAGSSLIELLFEPIKTTKQRKYIFLTKTKHEVSPDTKLLEILIEFFLPEKKGEPKQSWNAQVWNTLFSFIEKPNKSLSDFDKLDDDLKKAIQDFILVENIPYASKNTMASKTIPLNISALQEIFQNDTLQCKRYLLSLFKVILKKKLADENEFKKIEAQIQEALKIGTHEGEEVDHIKKIIDSIIPDILPQLTSLLPALFNEDYSIFDESMKIFSSHLDGVIEANNAASTYKATLEEIKGKKKKGHPLNPDEKKLVEESFNLASLSNAIINEPGTLTPSQKIMAQRIFGEKYLTFSADKIHQKVTEFHKDFPDYDCYLYFRNTQSAHKFLSGQAKTADVLGQQAAQSMDRFLSESLLKKILSRIVEMDAIKGVIKIDQAAKTIPFIKFVLRVCVHHLIKSSQDDVKNGFSYAFHEFFTPIRLKQLIIDYLFPSIKNSMVSFFVESVVEQNQDVLVQYFERLDDPELKYQLTEKCKKVFSDYEIQPLISDEEIQATLRGWLEEVNTCRIKCEEDLGITPNNDKKKKQFIELFFTLEKSENNPVYGELIEKGVFDLYKFPWWFRGIYRLFKNFISTFISANLFPYRKTDTVIIKSLYNFFNQQLGTEKLIEEKFFKKSEGGRVDKETITLQAPAVDAQLDRSIGEISRLIFASASYSASNKTVARCGSLVTKLLMGSNGFRLKQMINQVLNNVFFKSTLMNESLAFKLIDGFLASPSFKLNLLFNSQQKTQRDNSLIKMVTIQSLEN